MADNKGKYRTEIQQVRALCDISSCVNNPLFRQDMDGMSVYLEEGAVFARISQNVGWKHFGTLSEIFGAVPVYV